MRRAVSKDVRVLIGLLVILIIAGLISSGQQQAESELEIFPIRTTYSARPGGVKALYETLRALDYPVRRNTHEFSDRLDDGVLFVISPDNPISRSEWESLHRWVNRGNLLVLANNEPPIPERLGDDPPVTSATADVPSFLSSGVRSVRMAGSGRIKIKETAFAGQGAHGRPFG